MARCTGAQRSLQDLTTKNIANNAEIRKGPSSPMDADGTKAWLRRFGVGNQLVSTKTTTPSSAIVEDCAEGRPAHSLFRPSRYGHA